MLGPHRKFEVHTSFSCRDRANDAHKFSTNLRHYPYAKALARLLGESCQHIFYFDAFSGPLIYSGIEMNLAEFTQEVLVNLIIKTACGMI